MTFKEAVEFSTIEEGERLDKAKGFGKKVAVAALIGTTLMSAHKFGKQVYHLRPPVVRDVDPEDNHPEPTEEREKAPTLSKLIHKYKGNISYKFVEALLQAESNNTPSANSFTGAHNGRGIGQISEVALKEYNKNNKEKYKVDDLYDMDINIKITCWYLNWLTTCYVKQGSNDPANLYGSYNCGGEGWKKYKDQYYLKGKMPPNKDGKIYPYTALKKFMKIYDKK